MRLFTAVFYFLFFSLTAWGHTSRVDDQNAAKSRMRVVGLSMKGERSGLHFKCQTVEASALEVSSISRFARPARSIPDCQI